MRLFRKLPPLLACLALATGPALAKSKDGPDKGKDAAVKPADDKKDKDDKKGKGGKKQLQPGETPPPISLPLVKDHDSLGLKIPYYNEAGQLQMTFNIGVASRLDADRVRMKELAVETFNEEGDSEMSIGLPISVFNLSTRVITSDTKTTITREDMRITGDSVEFNTLTKQGKLVGNVHMTVYNIKAIATPDEMQTVEPGGAKP